MPYGAFETFIARPFLYPLIAPFYLNLGNRLAAVAAAAFATLAIGLFIRQIDDPSFRLGRNYLITNAVIVSAVMLVARRGLTVFFGSYDLASVDHYFLAANMMVLVVAVMLVAGVRRRTLRILTTGAIIVLPLSWFTILAVPERHLGAFAEHGTLRDAICEVARLPDHGSPDVDGTVAVPSYPYTEKHEWMLRVPNRMFDATARKHCTRLLPAVVVGKPAAPAESSVQLAQAVPDQAQP